VAIDARTLPYRWYSDEQILRREQERIFARSWQYGGRAEQVAKPGSFLATAAGHVPVLVVRDRRGELCAFVNVCRRRGAVLTKGSGSRETIHCRDHAWTYNLDGTPRTASRSDREDDFGEADVALHPASVGTWGPFLFVNPAANAEPLEQWLGELPAIVARDLDVNELVFHSRLEFATNANWKVAVENFLECYHCPTAHPSFSDFIDVHPDRYLLETKSAFSSQHCVAKANDERGQFHLLYPNTDINVYPGPANLSIGPMIPDGTSRTQRYLDYFFAADVDESWRDELLAFDAQVGREDVPLVESVQRGMASGVLENGRLLLNAEPLIAAFQAWISERLLVLRE
jgi:carnitine monooxygenase subunit